MRGSAVSGSAVPAIKEPTPSAGMGQIGEKRNAAPHRDGRTPTAGSLSVGEATAETHSRACRAVSGSLKMSMVRG